MNVQELLVIVGPVVAASIAIFTNTAKEWGMPSKRAPLFVLVSALVISVVLGWLAQFTILETVILFGLSAGLPMAGYDVKKQIRK